MSKAKARTSLYRLIEAGQLAHRALLVPLLDRGLEPGDDAIILALQGGGAGEADLAQELDLDAEVLAPRVERLIGRDVLARSEDAHLSLTERGGRIREVLSANWEQLEEALFAELGDRKRRRLDKALRRFTELLRLSRAD